jgi:F-type H+-transporting ATPase subunit a
MLFIFIGCARWYKNRKPEDEAPKGFVGLIEMFVMMVNDDIIKPSIGEKKYKKFAPYLLTAFFFIFLTNLLGLIPVFPGGANVTGNITITFFLAFATLLVTNLFGNKEYWKEIFWPDVPTWLKVPIPMMPVIEMFGIFTKPFALMVRLFANIMGGHAIILSMTCVIFITCQLGATIGTSLSVVSVILMIFMNCLEVLVAFIQAYVFTMLSAIFIGLANAEHHTAHK